MHWFIDPIKNHYADFEGRVGRQEFWMFILVYIGLYIAITVVEGIIGTIFLTTLFSLAVLVPNIAITARRLHDIDKSGWWQLIAFIPVVGVIILIVWLAGEGKKEDNEYGTVPLKKADPKAQASEEVSVPENVDAPSEPEEAVEENTQKGFGE